MQPLKKYRVQRDSFSCGSIAVYNFLVWAGLNPQRSDLNFIRKLLNAVNTYTDMDNLLNLMHVFTHAYDMQFIATRSIREPIRVLETGGSFMMVFDGGQGGVSHIAFCRGIKRGKISFINAVHGKKELLVTKQQLKNMMRNNVNEPLFLTIEDK